MAALPDLLSPYGATQVTRASRRGLWGALTRVAGDASVLPPDPVSDARVEEIVAEEARQALLSHLATL